VSTVRGPWSQDRLRTFLESAVQPLRLACRTPKDRLWLVTLWFVYRDGAFLCATSRDADVVEFLEAEPHVAFEVSTNDFPYRGVRGNGTAGIAADPEKALLTDLLERYMGGTDSALAEQLLAADREEVRLTIEPDVLATWDYSDRMSEG
jgi:nitroimidazol reductase NimA-like FMN-containing flavoprotein (pyridoxamine 5'-phosphate oxidase superfamily)